MLLMNMFHQKLRDGSRLLPPSVLPYEMIMQIIDKDTTITRLYLQTYSKDAFFPFG